MKANPHFVHRLYAIAFAVLLVAGVSLSTAQDDPVDQANALYNDIRPEIRSDPILLPALADLEIPPANIRDIPAAIFLTPGSPGWDGAVAWAQRPAQTRALDAMERVTTATGYVDIFGIAQGYGRDAASPELVEAGIYTELGSPPLLADAKFLYLDAVEHLAILANVEATRRLSSGDPGGALDLMVRLTALGDQVADREFVQEAEAGYAMMIDALHRARDIVYSDFRGERAIDPEALVDAITRLEDGTGVLAIERLNFPRANRIAAKQIINEVYRPSGSVEPGVFGATIVRLKAVGRPLQQFAAAGVDPNAADEQQNIIDINDSLDQVMQDYLSRWDLPRFAAPQQLPFRIEEIDDDATLAIGEAMLYRSEGEDRHGGYLFTLRTVAKVERIGTRLALAHVGRYYEQGLLAPQITSVRPRWLRSTEEDPWSPERRSGRLPQMQFFVPIRDGFSADPLRDPDPHTMTVEVSDDFEFDVTLGDDTFVLYSVGPDGEKGNAMTVSIEYDAVRSDYLLWPPFISLLREQLGSSGGLR